MRKTFREVDSKNKGVALFVINYQRCSHKEITNMEISTWKRPVVKSY